MAKPARRSITRWIHITDMQVGQIPTDADDHNAQVEELIAKVRAEKPDFVINSGDNTPGAVDDDERRFIAQCWRDYHRIVDPLASECPIFHTPGNHDQSRPGRSLDLYCKHVGREHCQVIKHEWSGGRCGWCYRWRCGRNHIC